MKSVQEFTRWLRPLLTGSGFEGKCFLVGGCVRDEFLGSTTKDLDVVVEIEGGAEKFCRFVAEKAKGSSTSPHHLGSGYPIWQIVFQDTVIEGSEEFHLQGIELQVADTQKEMFPDPETRQRITRFGTLGEDCLRRDFTCNMLYQDLTNGALLDPSASGVSDIGKKLLRGHPDVLTEKIFSEDPLRILRLFRFQARFDWKIDPSALEAVQKTKDRLQILSKERVRDEWIKVIAAGGHAAFFRHLKEQGILELLFPELLPMIACEQDKIYHAEGDVWVHTLLVMEKTPPETVLQLSALLHDVGKPATRSEHGERVKFLEHEKVSVGIAEEFLKKWKFPERVIREVLVLVALHLRGGDVEKWATLKPARKLLREAGDLMGPLMQLIEADSKSSLGSDGKPRLKHVELLHQKIREVEQHPPSPTPLLNGHEIMELLKIPGGPLIKRAQQMLIEAEDDALSAGKAWGRDEAEVYLKNHWTLPD